MKKIDTKNQIRKYLKDILEMIEDKNFPARRNISDYVELIIGEMKPEWRNEMCKFCNDYYIKQDINNPKQSLCRRP